MRPTAANHTLDALRTAEGLFAMVALDQRESLREMFPTTADGGMATDAALADFKADAVRTLSPYASGMLLDHPLGVPGPDRPEGLAAGCGLLLAADRLHSVRGEGVVDSDPDPAVDEDLIAGVGADALKYLVIWRRGDDGFRPGLAAFLDLAGRVGLPTFVEGIVRPPEGEQWRSDADRFDAIQEAALDLSRGASVYKAQVPGYSPGDLSAVEGRSRDLTGALEVPWVILSNGVAQADFPAAVAASLAGGADGFLAGRAIWSDTVTEPDPVAAVRDRSIPRLNGLAALVAAAANGRSR